MTKQIIINDCLDCPHSELRGTNINTYYSIFCLEYGVETERQDSFAFLTGKIPEWCDLKELKDNDNQNSKF